MDDDASYINIVKAQELNFVQIGKKGRFTLVIRAIIILLRMHLFLGKVYWQA